MLSFLPPDSCSLSCISGFCVAAIILFVCSGLTFKLSFLCVLGLCGLVLQRRPGCNIATAIHFATTVYTCSCPETLAEKCKLLFLNLNTDFHSSYYCCCAQVHLELFGSSSAFIAQILHTFLFEPCDALTSLLCLGCSHIVFNLAGVALLACKIPGFISDLWYTLSKCFDLLSECFIPNPKHHPAFYQEANPSLHIVRIIVVQIS